MPSIDRYFQVPYEGILSRKVDNPLVAGRSVAGDKVSQAATLTGARMPPATTSAGSRRVPTPPRG